jgi:hypothetical protein
VEGLTAQCRRVEKVLR